MLDKNTIHHVHCIGIGGIGVGGIAEFLLKQGFQVSGSDKSENKITKHLEELGAKIYIGHAAEHIDHADVVVYSSAIKLDNPEYVAAKNKRIHLLQRAEMLAELMSDSRNILVSGTHGKTTTTSLVSALLVNADMDPSFMIGGKLNGMQGPAHLGQGEYFVAEADESDASFLSLHPEITIVNNIEPDHMETYHGNFSELTDTFLKFLRKIPVRGLAILGIDDPATRALLPEVQRKYVTFGFSKDADIRATNFYQEGLTSRFTAERVGKPDLSVELNLPGKHNVLNALAMICVGDHLKISDAVIQQTLKTFAGVGRRFHAVGEMTLPKNGKALIIDDYGHHPGAIRVTLEAARLAFPDRRIVLVFQPHRYTRTHDLMQEFAEALSLADTLVLLEVFSAGETFIAGADGKSLCAAVEKIGKIKPVFVSKIDELPATLQTHLRDQDVAILQGAGDIGTLPSKLIQL